MKMFFGFQEKKFFLCLCWMLALMFVSFSSSKIFATPATGSWIKISEDQKYGKYYSPAKIRVAAQQNGVATNIEAWTKTSYTRAGAEETILNYGIEASIPDPNLLSYSLALVEICPQERTLTYVQEDFYDANDKVIWSKVYSPKISKEINSRAYDEDYFDAIVDVVFRVGESARKNAPDRWKLLWVNNLSDGSTVKATFDTTTARLQDSTHLIFWEWQESKDQSGSITEIQFAKKIFNSSIGAEKILQRRTWTPDNQWQDTTSELDGEFHAIPKTEPEVRGLNFLKAYINGYTYWLNRYSTDKNQIQAAQNKLQAKKTK